MKITDKSRVVTIKVDTTYKYLQLWNGIFNLTFKELTILSYFIDTRKIVEGDNLCGGENKKKVAELMGLKDHNTLNNYVKRFKDKGVILKVKNDYNLLPLLEPNTDQITIKIKQ